LVTSKAGSQHYEVYVVDLPEDMTVAGESPLQGTEAAMPAPPRGTVQRRITFTDDRDFPGIQGTRHWLRASPDGSHIAFLMKDVKGVAQIWLVSPNGGELGQLTHNPWDVGSAFTWSPDGSRIAYAMDNSVFTTDLATGSTSRLTPRSPEASAPQPYACVFSPDGKQIAYVRKQPGGCDQIYIASASQVAAKAVEH
jgi:Tol biopolymer transport system component